MKYTSTFCRSSVLIFLFFVSTQISAQTLRGIVRAASNFQPITGATVSIYPSKSEATPLAVATSPEGEFEFENLRAGYYRCEVSAIGFETVYLTETQVEAGKEHVLEIELRSSNTELPEVTIATSAPGGRPLQPMSEIPLTRDQTLRFPAMFFDPGRLAAAFPGVSQVDDGTNMMSIRGNSPAMVRWRIEGLDIVNPNHLPNAGTFSDAPAGASGGVLMFSAQMLDNSSLLTGAFPAGYGDAVAGVMDMNLRTGNKREHEFTAQAGLIGLDLAAEGPLSKKHNSSYLVNYRYSTVGLLGELGVSFGDEQINFQDLSVNLNFTGKKGGQYSVFGLGGLSENVFTHKEDTTEIKYDKERHDIDFKSKTGVFGASGKWLSSPKSWIKAALVYSCQNNYWNKQVPGEINNGAIDDRTEGRISSSVEYHLSYSAHKFSAGLQSSITGFEANIGGAGNSYFQHVSHLNLQPWLRWDWNSQNGRWNSQLGAQFHYNTAYKELAPAPRGLLSYRIASKHRVSLSAGLYKQDAPIWLQYVTSPFPGPDYRAPYISSFQSGIRYTWNPSLFWKITAELFQQNLDNIPANLTSTLSLFNNPEFITDQPVFGESKARNRGLELGVERSLHTGWFFAANGSIFRSDYQLIRDQWLHSRWDIGHLSNVTFGKEWQREKTAGITRIIGVGIRGVWAGGPREANIDLAASMSAKRTIFDESAGYVIQNADYFRADIRVYWKRNLGDRRNSIFALDIQNLTGQQNLAYHYYEPFTGKIENKYQLGPIPNFSWRMEF
ncbi:MAG: TonB-dependent receptor [Saprospiraceae bacterium]